MNVQDAFHSRFQFEPPPAFVQMLSPGRDEIDWVLLPGFRWLSAAEIAGWRFSEHHWEGFVPFGTNDEGDLWCWCPDMAVSGVVPVGFCPANCEEGEIYARDFASAVLRLVCDSARHLSAQPGLLHAARALLGTAAERSALILPAESREWLKLQSAREPSAWRTPEGMVSGIPGRVDYEYMIATWVDDGEVGSVFRWMTAP